MKRSLFTFLEFDDETLPKLPCPNCGNGPLYIREKEDVKYQETSSSIAVRKHENWDPDWIRYTFTATLHCKNCSDVVRTLGTGRITYYNERDENGFEGETHSCLSLTPLFFYPSLEIFELHPKTPENIASEIKSSFRVFFTDPSASANHLRSAVEELLTALRIPKSSITKGKRRQLPLHARIERLHKKHPHYSDPLLALKWIGNAGSHPTKISQTDILDGYEIMENLLHELVEKRTENLKRITKDILKNKGPRYSRSRQTW